MLKHLVAITAVAAAFAVPAPATDTSSLAAFISGCSADYKACRSMTLNAVISARNAGYGCIPKDTSNETAAERLLDWLKNTANRDPKYAGEPLADLMWTGIDEVWPCKK